MAVTHDKPKYTVEDYMRLPEGERVELINGELLVSPSPRRSHQRVVGMLYRVLSQWVEERKLGEVLVAPFDVVLSKHDVVQPDVLFISRERSRISTEDNVRGAPDLVVEILSPGTEKRDKSAKKALYELHGVKEYWIVDTEKETIEQLVARDGKFVSLGVFSAGGILESPALAGFSFQPGSVFRR